VLIVSSFLPKGFTLATLLIVAISACPTQAQVGFQASLYSSPSSITSYVEDENEFSVALRPKYKAFLSSEMMHRPKAVASSYEQMSIRLEWDYYRRRDVKSSLVPVSVGAFEYLQYRIATNEARATREARYNFMTRADERGKGGLGISVGLPRRLDRIFGEGGAGLKVAGYRRIMFAGRSQWTDGVESETLRQSKFPSLRMEQISRFEITGTIGSKISVKVSQDSQTDIPLANRIQIRYKGDDDDILRSIEAGNTTLSLPNTKFVGYSSRIRGLFGLKAEAQLGQLSLTAIASQEKGSTERASFTATGEENADFIRDYEYVERRVFDLFPRDSLLRTDRITRLFVYESVLETENDWVEAPAANLYVDPRNKGAFDEDQEGSSELRMRQLPVESYEFFDDSTRNLHYVVFSRPRDKSRLLACYVEITSADGTVTRYGNVDASAGSALDLKLLAPVSEFASPDQATWQLMWRNCYPIPVNIDIDDIRVKIYKGLPGTEEDTDNREYQASQTGTFNYIEILGLDQFDELDQRKPDNLLDPVQDVFRPEWGLLIFPHRRPFASDTTFESDAGRVTPVLDPQVPTIYDYASASVKTENSQYYLQLITTARSSRIKLDRANIIEGSETITVNGRQLARGTDYQINYEFGQITLLTEEATDPNASLSIDYEYAPFFAVQKKTLLGARAEYEWSKDFTFGSTILYKSDKTQERKPKVGQETAKMVVLDGDFSLKLHPNFLTAIANAVPLVETESPSNLSIVAEVAQSRPNPNVDGVAYVDDFESALEQLSLGTSRTRWKPASEPYPLGTSDFVKSKMLWHSPPNPIPVEQIYDREAAQGEGTIRTLRLIFRPDTTVTNSWSGIMRYFGAGVDSKRAQLFEVRLKPHDVMQSRIHFDFGRINGDLDQDGSAFTEDANNNGAVDEVEDIGLDGLSDEFESRVIWGTDTDPASDNWYFRGEGKCPFPDCDPDLWKDTSYQYYYEYLNGTEGNRFDAGVAGLPDRENLSPGSGAMERTDAYYSFVLDLAANPDSFLVPNSERNGWVTYRIPIRDSAAVDAFVTSSAVEPTWDRITHVRVWFEGALGQTEHDTLEIADWYFVQSNWQDSVIFGPDSALSNTKFVVAEMSEDQNQDFTPPPGVEAYTDPTTNVTEAQRALLMDFRNLRNSDSCLATKDLLTVDRYSGYRRLEMFVYGDYDDPADAGKIQFFFRIGPDAKNYYEYYTNIYQGWDERNAVNIDFNAITAFKDQEQKKLLEGMSLDADDGVHYRIFGNPDINKIRYFSAGLVNADPDSSNEISGQLWLDELRVTEVRRDVGTAGRLQLTGNIADLLNYTYNFESRDPYFRGLSTSTRGGSTDNLGSGETKTTYNMGVTLNINKFLPRSWGARLPVSLWYDKSTQTPLLRNNSDIVLPPETREEEKTVRETRRMSVNASFNRKGRNPIFSLLLNRLKSSFSYSRFNMTSVTTPYNFGESYSVRSSFDLGVEKVPTAPIFFWTRPFPILRKISDSRLWLYPEKWTTSGDFARNLTITDDINLNRRTSSKRSFNGRMDMTYRVFNNLTLNYSMATNRDLSDQDLVNISLKNFKLGLETHYAENFKASYDPRLFSFLRTNFSLKADYSDDWQRQYKAKRSALSRSRGVSGQFDHQVLIGKSKKKGGRRQPVRKGEKIGDSEDGEGFGDKIMQGLRLATGWIDPVSYSYTETYNNSLPGMDSRPHWHYRFGLRDDAGVGEVPEAVGSQSAKEGVRYELSSGFTFLGGVATRVKYARSVNTDLIKQGSRYENTSTSWPDLSIRIQKFKTFPVIKGILNTFIDVFSPRTGFTRQVRDSRDIDLDFVASRSEDMDYRPLLSLNFKVFRALSLSAAYTLNKGTKQTYSSTTGELQTETITTRKSVALTGKYSFSSPRGISLPIFGRLKFTSTVEIEATVRINSNVSETSQSGGPFVISQDKSDLMFSPVVSYSFSRQIRGGLTMRWQDSNDNHRNRKNHTREVQVWTEINF